jgi:G6PDH family F420-dependent oxidoreductase
VVLGAAAQATQALPLMTFVTCPTFRYHPVVVAQQAATLGVLSSGRFTLGLGAGENLNEHVIGGGWPMGRVRQERLAEAVEIIRSLFTGDYVNFSGQHFQVERARLYDLPDSPPPIGIAASGPSSVKLAASHGDALIAVQPDGGLIAEFAAVAGAGKPKHGQLPICYDRDEKAARARARELTPASRTWPSFRPAPEASRTLSRGRQRNCCPRSGNSENRIPLVTVPACARRPVRA